MNYEIVAEKFNFTNAKALKQFFSDTTQSAASYTKQANKAFNKKDFKEAGDLYKKALPLWNETIKTMKDIPETNVGPFALSNWIIWAPFVNLAYLIILSIQSYGLLSALPGNGLRYADEKLVKKLNEALQTKSISKQGLIQSYVIIQDFVEDRIKECEHPTKSSFESFIPQLDINMQMEGYLEMIEEGFEGLPWLDQTSGYHSVSESSSVMSEYIRSFV